MTGQTMGGSGSSGRQYAIEQSSEYRYGERTECELCKETKQCFDEHDILACKECQSALLPTSGLL